MKCLLNCDKYILLLMLLLFNGQLWNLIKVSFLWLKNDKFSQSILGAMQIHSLGQYYTVWDCIQITSTVFLRNFWNFNSKCSNNVHRSSRLKCLMIWCNDKFCKGKWAVILISINKHICKQTYIHIFVSCMYEIINLVYPQHILITNMKPCIMRKKNMSKIKSTMM